MKKKYKIIGEIVPVMGHIRYGYQELTLSEEQYQEFLTLSEEDKLGWLEDGEVEVTDIRLNDYEYSNSFTVEEIEIAEEGEETVTITVEEYENLLAARELKNKYLNDWSKASKERDKYEKIIEELSDAYGQNFLNFLD